MTFISFWSEQCWQSSALLEMLSEEPSVAIQKNELALCALEEAFSPSQVARCCAIRDMELAKNLEEKENVF